MLLNLTKSVKMKQGTGLVCWLRALFISTIFTYILLLVSKPRLELSCVQFMCPLCFFSFLCCMVLFSWFFVVVCFLFRLVGWCFVLYFFCIKRELRFWGDSFLGTSGRQHSPLGCCGCCLPWVVTVNSLVFFPCLYSMDPSRLSPGEWHRVLACREGPVCMSFRLGILQRGKPGFCFIYPFHALY